MLLDPLDRFWDSWDLGIYPLKAKMAMLGSQMLS